ncbi:MAG: type 1 glutamine amidotransferase domain-containing protein [Thermoprotei archaeon]|jgi:protease I
MVEAGIANRALILIGEGFEEVEFFYPYYRLIEADFQVDVASTEAGKIKGKHGLEFEAKCSAKVLKGVAYDIIVIPGGWGPDRLRRDSEVLRIVKEAFEEYRVIAAICHGPQVLISAGILKNKKVTGARAIWDDLRNAGAEVVDEPVVVDGNIVTSRAPPDLPHFMKKTLELVGKYPKIVETIETGKRTAIIRKRKTTEQISK